MTAEPGTEMLLQAKEEREGGALEVRELALMQQAELLSVQAVGEGRVFYVSAGVWGGCRFTIEYFRSVKSSHIST